MATTEINRSHWIDDSGTGRDGSILNNAELQGIYENVDDLIDGNITWGGSHTYGNAQHFGFADAYFARVSSGRVSLNGRLDATILTTSAGMAIDGASPSTHGIVFAAATPGSTTAALYSPDGVALWFNGAQLATGSSVSGTTGTIGKFTGATAIGNSIITESGTRISIAGELLTTANHNVAPATAIDAGLVVFNATNGGIRVFGTGSGKLQIAEIDTTASFTRLLLTQDTHGSSAMTFAGAVTGSGGFIGALTGNASTATSLQTARLINGVSFNGTADITVTAAAGTLTGATLASGVTASSLTSVGTLTSGALGSGFTTVPVARGGTGATSFVANRVLIGNGTSAVITSSGLVYTGTELDVTGAVVVSGTASFGGDVATPGLMQAAYFLPSGTAASDGMALKGTHGLSFWASSALAMSIYSSGGVYIGSSSTDLGAGNLGVGGVVLGANGNAGAPTHSFEGDSDTGLYRFAANMTAIAGAGRVVAQFDANSLGHNGLIVAGRAAGTGANKLGAGLSLGRNSSGNGAPGMVAFEDRTGVTWYVWADSTGHLRISSSFADESTGDLIGSLV